jgi:hypothetical protein
MGFVPDVWFELKGSNLDKTFLAFISGSGIRRHGHFFSSTCFGWHGILLMAKLAS